MQAKLRLGTDPYLIGSVADFTFKWGLNAGLNIDEASRLTMAVNELATDVVLFAYPESDGEYEITFYQEPSFLEVILTETGIPFDPGLHPYHSDKALKEENFDGAGFEIIQKMSDAFVFLNHGKRGKEYRILKKLPEGQIVDISTESDLLKSPDPDEDFTYTLHQAAPEDAEAISKLFYRVYKNTYTKDVMYYPRMVERAIKHKERFGVLVRTQDNDTIGFFAILRTTDSMIGEIGEAAVDSKHRRKGLMSQMIKELIDEARKKGLLGLFGEAVTVHTISQKVNMKYGMSSTALLLGMFPNALYSGLNDRSVQNVSVMIDFLHLNHEKDQYAYIPTRYKRIVTDIYDNLGIELHSLKTDKTVPMVGLCETDLKIDYEGQNALLVINKYGEDLVDLVRQTEMDLRRYQINVFMIDLPLDRTGTKIAPDLLRDQGFIFSGIMPLFHSEKDYLRIQKPLCELDLNQVYAYSVIGKKIKRFIIKERNELRAQRQKVQG